MLDSQRKIRRIIPEQRLLQLLIEERQLTGGFAPVGRYKFNVLDPSVGTPVHSQIQLPRASELVRPAHISAGAAGQHHGKVLAYCELEATQQRPECRRHSPSATCQQSWIGVECHQAGLRDARRCAGITLFFAVGPQRSWHGSLHVPHPFAVPSPAAVPPGPASPVCRFRLAVMSTGAAW